MSPIENGPESHADRFAEGDDVARLLRLAGPRPAVPVDDMNAAREAARAEWRRQVSTRRRRAVSWQAGGWLAAAAVLLAVGVTLWQWLQVSPVATLELARGAVTVVPEAGAESILLSEATVTTDDGRAALRMASGHSVRLDAGTRLKLVSRSALELESGAVYVDSQAAAGTFEVRTSLGVARDVGTQFEVRLADGAGLSVRVREGLVELTRDGESHTADAGTELQVAADGTLTRSAVPLHGALWEWVLEIAPGFDAEGRKLRDLLDWAAREGGWELAFADDELAAVAAATDLSGPVEELRPEEAVAVMVRATGLAYRIDDGVLLIERPR